jgi:dynein heavy chain 1
VPFDAILTLMSECVYGGKIDNAFDRRLLDTFLKRLFTVKSFENDFKLVQDDSLVVTMPDAIRREQFIQWIDNLKHQETPLWLGLPNSAEKVLLSNYGTEITNKLLKLSIMDEEEDELAYSSNEEDSNKKTKEISTGQPLWMRQLQQATIEWKKLLPVSLVPIKRTIDNIKDPLFRFFEREINTGLVLIKKVIQDLEDVLSICKGDKKQTNYHRQLLKDLAKGLYLIFEILNTINSFFKIFYNKFKGLYHQVGRNIQYQKI